MNEIRLNEEMIMKPMVRMNVCDYKVWSVEHGALNMKCEYV